ncbi:uncharacterized protein LOC106168922 [Lingula anatina]|uniref:Uncharacterized protein LOC106168922 n=1 Tax=Lingula anatina TaxID=7574 RepID=A0A1S3J053_LINAN|nr:uncharacterized protein LOC106168922 [Lingula anatina]|eukprot:XP_013403638.1 uncharacterized protein LOC106168922 [Lingula anatina]
MTMLFCVSLLKIDRDLLAQKRINSGLGCKSHHRELIQSPARTNSIGTMKPCVLLVLLVLFAAVIIEDTAGQSVARASCSCCGNACSSDHGACSCNGCSCSAADHPRKKRAPFSSVSMTS